MDKTTVHKKLLSTFGLSPESSKILIVGLGHTGLSVARYLNKLDFAFALTDSRKNPPMNYQLLSEMPDVAVFTGGFDKVAFATATHLVVSPGISLKDPVIQNALSNNIQLIGDIDLFSVSVSAPVVAITGSNGKSTVTSMVAKMAEADDKHVAIGGNYGTPALDLIDPDIDLFVLELSSFQLERTDFLQPTAATVLNISEDHLDRYSNINEYVEAKQKIFNGEGVMILNADDPFVIGMIEPDREVLTFGLENGADFHLSIKQERECLAENGQCFMDTKELPLFGSHNIANALAAWALGKAIGLSETAMLTALKGFKGLDHRMQAVAEINGITWINDSKATNVGACVAALKGMNRKVVLIAGGDAKNADMRELAPILEKKVKAVVLMGKDAPLIQKIITDTIPTKIAKSMRDAVNQAATLAGRGDCVLLSPACASLDQFKNYKERGKLFSKAVKELAA